MSKFTISQRALFLSLTLCFALEASAAALSSASSTAFTVPNGTFEVPALPASPGYAYAPAGSGWTMASGAGLSRNATAFTSGNPNAPEGAQVLVLQSGGTASRAFNFTAGYYVFSFSTAQRGNDPTSAQSVQLLVDGTALLTASPVGATYQRLTAGPVLLASGPHTVELRGLKTQGGDTAFVDDFRASRVRDISISGFESPAIPTSPGFVYAPTGGPWSLSAGAGLARNGSAFTVANPAAPEGAQVLFLQGPATATTAVTIPRTGHYRFRLRAALRANDPTQPPAKDVRVTINGTEVGHFRLGSIQYTEHVSTVLALNAGPVTVSVVGEDTSPGDHTGLVDDLRMEMVHDWNDAYVWGGTVPTAGDSATVGVGSAVSLQGTLTPGAVVVNGEVLGVQNRPVSLTTRYVMVMGPGSLFELGQELTPYPSTAVITLNASDPTLDVMEMGNKFLGAMGNATLRLHGEERVSWTQLQGSVSAGSNSLVLKQPVNWRPNDVIVIVSSTRNWNEAEQRVIQSLDATSTRLTLTSPLTYGHTGVQKTYSNGSRTWTADLRAQVGLLTHNIKVQGDSASEASGFGGHVMIMDSSRAHISGVELYNMGQKAKRGRYPFHWHMLGAEGAGQYFKNSSIHHSYNRAITIHGTESTLVENNFFHDHIGHGVFLEDGSERFNVIKRNVTLLTRRPASGQEVTPSDNQLNNVQNRTPASYWITNPQNTFEDNVAAGTEGTGFWFAFPDKPMGLSAEVDRFKDMPVRTLPLISFKGNSAHSTMSGFDIFDRLSPDHRIEPNHGWLNPDLHVIEGGTWYANALALYTGIGAGGPTDNLVFRDNILVDNTVGTMLASYSVVEQSLFVADSGENLVGGERTAYRVYDGAGQVRDSHFVGWTAANANFLMNTGAAVKHPNHTFLRNTMAPAGPPRIRFCDESGALCDATGKPTPGTDANHPRHPRVWSTVLRDLTGTITGKPNTAIVSNHPFMRVGDEYQPPNWEYAYRSDHRFALSRLSYYDDNNLHLSPNLTCTRRKAGTPTEHVYYVDGYREWHQLPVIVSEGYEYTYAYESLPPTKSVLMQMEDATAGDSYIAHFKDFGKLGGLSYFSNQGSFPPYPSLAALRAASSTGYYVQPGGDLSIKAVATGRYQAFVISWATNFVVPPLDTDGDLMPDSVEIRAGRHAFDASDLSVEFNTLGDTEGWVGTHIAGQAVSGGVLTGTSSSADAILVNSDYDFDATRVATLRVHMRSFAPTGVQLFFATDTQPGFSGTRVATVGHPGGGTYQTLTFNMQGVSGWNGTITDLRLDPVSGAGIAFDIDWIRATAP
ncbi:G8 domain-containing protein [Myxococcus qinghaiensis]|uniref:G8 domain-containing protein n=1 Tax=Myxococcus qinghaiensis TaxID=2906758 RepID=UPI0020A8342E|nr:G8 domain-containing protein [Myxococcus qinghaiensis]MCP3164213.1 right-handed parallel beta-helix repeat-containing protein [Myxococcus qinghaiensis]